MTGRISVRPLLATRADTERFVGRTAELTRLEANLEAGINTLVLAQRGAGLTSFLNRAVYDLERRSAGELEVVVLPGEVARSAADLLAAVADRVTRSAPPRPASGPDDRGAERALGDRGAAVAAPSGEQEGARLLAATERLRQAIDAAARSGPTVVVIDGLARPEVAHTVFGQLRNELWQIEAMTWVLGGAAAQRGRYLEPPADAFWESVIELAPLSADELGAIVDQHDLPESDPGSRRELIAAAAGNPLQLLLAARAAAQGRPPDRRQPDPDLGESAARLMHYLQTQGPASASDGGLLNELGWSRGRAQQVLKGLEQAGLVRAELAPAGGAPGRPRKVYRVAEPVHD
ncbi:MAG TPA: hypothetical protein VGH45_09810 [Solirubrobacteraceae bacterium]